MKIMSYLIFNLQVIIITIIILKLLINETDELDWDWTFTLLILSVGGDPLVQFLETYYSPLAPLY